MGRAAFIIALCVAVVFVGCTTITVQQGGAGGGGSATSEDNKGVSVKPRGLPTPP
jgi:hypothetical protein